MEEVLLHVKWQHQNNVGMGKSLFFMYLQKIKVNMIWGFKMSHYVVL